MKPRSATIGIALILLLALGVSVAYADGLIIDIKPRSFPNSINLRSHGVVRVAVLAPLAFDAGAIDPGAVLFGCAHPERWRMQDVNGDGLMDVVFFFRTDDFTCLSATSAVACLHIDDGVDGLAGCDSVRIVPPGR